MDISRYIKAAGIAAAIVVAIAATVIIVKKVKATIEENNPEDALEN